MYNAQVVARRYRGDAVKSTDVYALGRAFFDAPSESRASRRAAAFPSATRLGKKVKDVITASSDEGEFFIDPLSDNDHHPSDDAFEGENNGDGDSLDPKGIDQYSDDVWKKTCCLFGCMLKHSVPGGIIADEVGVRKTRLDIATILLRNILLRSHAKVLEEWGTFTPGPAAPGATSLHLPKSPSPAEAAQGCPSRRGTGQANTDKAVPPCYCEPHTMVRSIAESMVDGPAVLCATPQLIPQRQGNINAYLESDAGGRHGLQVYAAPNLPYSVINKVKASLKFAESRKHFGKPVMLVAISGTPMPDGPKDVIRTLPEYRKRLEAYITDRDELLKSIMIRRLQTDKFRGKTITDRLPINIKYKACQAPTKAQQCIGPLANEVKGFMQEEHKLVTNTKAALRPKYHVLCHASTLPGYALLFTSNNTDKKALKDLFAAQGVVKTASKLSKIITDGTSREDLPRAIRQSEYGKYLGQIRNYFPKLDHMKKSINQMRDPTDKDSHPYNGNRYRHMTMFAPKPASVLYSFMILFEDCPEVDVRLIHNGMSQNLEASSGTRHTTYAWLQEKYSKNVKCKVTKAAATLEL
ncbi:hypothetical protein DL767_007707 [Monosporascus sp. MG133]|nr:hypothetical protein DL767_007707 [Monosporascus sp. MG133]